MNVPARLDVILDDIGVGAMLKHMETDRRAVVIDITADGFPVVAMIRDEWVDREDGEEAHSAEHYEILVLGMEKKKKGKGKRKTKKIIGGSGWRYATEDMKKWLVLEAGHDRLLSHVEDP